MTVGTGWTLEGKNIAVLGVADESSIAWSVAKAFAARGARVHIGYQQRFFSRVRLLLRGSPEIDGQRCDVLQEAELQDFFSRFQSDPLDALIHSVAFGPAEVFSQHSWQVSREGFLNTLEISTCSLASVVRHAQPNLRDGASVIAMTFQASLRATELYGLMGVAKAALESLVRLLALELGERRIRVNAISPGLILTPAAVGEGMALLSSAKLQGRLGEDLRKQLDQVRQEPTDDVSRAISACRVLQQAMAAKCPIPEAVSGEDVANCALFLASSLAQKITGQVIHVDCGMSSSLLL